jgi:hypothetical protein
MTFIQVDPSGAIVAKRMSSPQVREKRRANAAVSRTMRRSLSEVVVNPGQQVLRPLPGNLIHQALFGQEIGRGI